MGEPDSIKEGVCPVGAARRSPLTINREDEVPGNPQKARKWLLVDGSRAGVLAALVAGALVAWLAGLIHFAQSLPQRAADPNAYTDAVVVLTGGSERLATSVRLLADQRAERLFISGVHPSVDSNTLVSLLGNLPEDLQARIDAGRNARDTAENADETAEWFRAHGFRSLRLVTSSYHMPRSLLEFSRALPEAKVIPHPVVSERVRHDNWWQSPGTATLIVTEYTKYLLASGMAVVRGTSTFVPPS